MLELAVPAVHDARQPCNRPPCAVRPRPARIETPMKILTVGRALLARDRDDGNDDDDDDNDDSNDGDDADAQLGFRLRL